MSALKQTYGHLSGLLWSVRFRLYTLFGGAKGLKGVGRVTTLR